ncbi:MAG: HK97 family phage prohead protease, partial [Planctomycetota bacterium]
MMSTAAILEDLSLDLIELLAERGQRRTMGGHGIRTADAYVRGIVACADDEVCSRIALPKGFDWDPPAMLRESAGRLVYSNDEMRMTGWARDTSLQVAKAAGIDLPPRTLMTFENVITTPLRDRDGDILRSEGAVIDEKMPLLWHHMPPMPVGKMLKVIKQSKKGVKVLTALIDSQLGQDAAALIEFGALRISHGFRPLEFDEMKDGGYDIKKFEIMEESLVTVPSNTDAVITAFSRGKLGDPLVKSWAKSISDARPAQGRGMEFRDDHVEVERWNKSLGKGFDIVREHLEPSNLEYDWVSRWAGCQVKELYQVCSNIPSYRLGSWLTGLRYAMRDWKLEDTRSITYQGKEVPPQYEVIQLNSKMSDTFMIDGIEF